MTRKTKINKDGLAEGRVGTEKRRKNSESLRRYCQISLHLCPLCPTHYHDRIWWVFFCWKAMMIVIAMWANVGISREKPDEGGRIHRTHRQRHSAQSTQGKGVPKLYQSSLKVVSKFPPNCIKVVPKLYQTCPKVLSKLSQSSPKIVSKLSQMQKLGFPEAGR